MNWSNLIISALALNCWFNDPTNWGGEMRERMDFPLPWEREESGENF